MCRWAITTFSVILWVALLLAESEIMQPSFLQASAKCVCVRLSPITEGCCLVSSDASFVALQKYAVCLCHALHQLQSSVLKQQIGQSVLTLVSLLCTNTQCVCDACGLTAGLPIRAVLLASRQASQLQRLMTRSGALVMPNLFLHPCLMKTPTRPTTMRSRPCCPSFR